MKYFADNDGKYLGGNDVGITPDGMVYSTDKKPSSNEQYYDDVNDEWVDELA